MPKEVDKSPALAEDRRRHPRYKFIAEVEIAETATNRRIRTRVGDLSQQGLYVLTSDPFSLGTVVTVCVTKGVRKCNAVARVVFSRAKTGMGLLFTTIESEHLRILSTWISEARESAWLALSRRRSQRVLLRVPLRICGQNGSGSPFEEETETTTVSAHGALLLLSMSMARGQAITLANKQTSSAAECIVVHLGEAEGDRIQVGVEFVLPSPAFWHVAFPPKDWSVRHPDAKVTRMSSV